MTRTTITLKSASDIKKRISKNAKHHQNMYKSDQNIRPRKNVSNWIQPIPLKNDVAMIENDYKKYENDYYHNYHPIRTSRPIIKLKTEKNHTVHVQAVRKYVQDYCEVASLHGLRYIGAPDVTLCERIFWILSFAGAVGFAAFFISNIYNRWLYNPLIVGINPEYQTIYNIPFPALTVCNMNQARKEVAERVLKGNNESEKWLLEDICDAEDNSTQNITDLQTTDWEFIKNFILKLSQPCSDLLVQCKWQGYEIKCTDIINSALTDEGVCCTFNRVHKKFMYHNPTNLADFNISFPFDNIDWTPETGYPANSTNRTWPFRGQGAGEHLGLTLIINVAANEYYCSSTNSVGLKIRLHSPVETPMMADYGFFLHPRKEVRVAVRPTMDEASESINNIPIQERQCFFSIEKQLYYYRTYTKMNCELECLSNYTLQKCDCVPLYLPKNVNTTICDKRKESCYMEAKLDMNIQLHPSIHCDCLPACNEISYAQDHSLGDISKPELRKGIASQIEPSNLIILHVFYQTTQFRSYEKSEIFGFTEFLSNSGGLLGLFLGFSFLSAVEIVYHLTLRLWCVYYRKRKEHEKTVVVYPFTR